ncbi:MAG TPA: 3D domain-containing protein [Patescibacteria group bacterium]|nr:3D domain-containing protein [Patescibacteria group bacterium]
MKSRIKRWAILCLALFCCSVTAVQASSLTSKPAPPPLKSARPVPDGNLSSDTQKLKRLQQLLADTGFYPGLPTGKLDAMTKEAIEKGQKTFKLKKTGIYDANLVSALNREVTIKPVQYKKRLDMEASAYTAEDPGSGHYTKRGNRLRKGLVAVDPRVIPLGTRLYVEGYGYAVADDIGSAIKGEKIDLAYDNRQNALQFGRHPVMVYVLE